MVEYDLYLNNLFGSLSDPIRRDILLRLVNAQQTIGQLAEKYNISFAAVAKHIKVLENAKLIVKTRKGNQQLIALEPLALKDLMYYLKQYESLWEERFNKVDYLLKDKDE